MAELPLLFFPEPNPTQRRKLGGGGSSYSKPSAAEQRRRLDARFREIAESFHAVQDSPQGLEPEQVLVLETVGETSRLSTRSTETTGRPRYGSAWTKVNSA